MIRDAFLSLVSDETPVEAFLALLHATTLPQNRTHTTQFFELLKEKEMDPLFLDLFFRDLTAVETRFESEPDATFIGMLSLLQPTKDNLQLTFDRLFATPTVGTRPFAFTFSSRSAGLEFLSKGEGLHFLDGFLRLIPTTPSSRFKLCDEFQCHIGCVVGRGLWPKVLQILGRIDPFVQAMVATSFHSKLLRDLSCLFGDLRYGVTHSIQCPLSLPPFASVPHVFDFFFGAITSELGALSILPCLFACERSLYHTVDVSQNSHDLAKQIGLAKWPPYLLLNVANARNDFVFPLAFENGYRLLGILAHETVVIAGDDRNWYSLHDGVSDRFDMIDWCYNPLFLVYAKASDEPETRKMTDFVEDFVNQRNMANWPGIVCSTAHFVNFVRKHFEPDIPLFHVFTGVVCGDHDVFRQWYKWLLPLVSKNDSANDSFSDYCWNELGSSILDLISLSDFVANGIGNMLKQTRKPFAVDKMAGWFELPQAPGAFEFACDLVVSSLKSSGPSGQLKDILMLLKNGKFHSESVHEKACLAFNAAIHAISGVFKISVDPQLAALLSDATFLELWIEHIENCPGFFRVIQGLPPECFSGVSERVRDVLGSVVQFALDPNVAALKLLPFDTFCEMFSCVMFSSNDTARGELMDLTLKVMQQPRPEFVDFIMKSLVCESLEKPVPFAECPWAHSLLQLVPRATESVGEDVCDEFSQLLETIFFVAPTGCLVALPEICEMFVAANPESLAAQFLFDVIHHILVFDRVELPRGVVARIMEMDYHNSTAVQMLFMLRQFADKSRLAASCVEYVLATRFDENSDMLLGLFTCDEPLVPGRLMLPTTLFDLLSLRLVTALWKRLPDMREKLEKVIKAVMRMATPNEFFKQSPCVQEALMLIGKWR
jgi:hypothetical protein